MCIGRQSFTGTLGALSLLLALGACETSHAFSPDSVWEHLYRHVDFLPEYHMQADIFMFFLHKNAFLKERYFLESNTGVELALLSVRRCVYFLLSFDLQSRMGQTPGNVVFDPMDINYGIVPVFEFRLPLLNVMAGLDHSCFHEIDRKDFKTVYWNKLYAAAGSKNMRLYDFWQALTADDGWTAVNRVAWYLSGGYYLRSFFGLVSEHAINGENKYLVEAAAQARYAFYRRRSWIMNLRGGSTVGCYKNIDGAAEEHGPYWRLDLGVETNFRRGKKGGMLFCAYTLDRLPTHQGLPRFSKDRLLQLGVRFFI